MKTRPEYDTTTLQLRDYAGGTHSQPFFILDNLRGKRFLHSILITDEAREWFGSKEARTYHEHAKESGEGVGNILLAEDMPLLNREYAESRYWFHTSTSQELPASSRAFHVGTVRAALYRRTAAVKYREYVHVLRLRPDVRIADHLVEDDGAPTVREPGEVVRYINAIEAPGSVSLVAYRRDLFEAVDTIVIPSENKALRLWEVPTGAQRKLREYANATVPRQRCTTNKE